MTAFLADKVFPASPAILRETYRYATVGLTSAICYSICFSVSSCCRRRRFVVVLASRYWKRQASYRKGYVQLTRGQWAGDSAQVVVTLRRNSAQYQTPVAR